MPTEHGETVPITRRRFLLTVGAAAATVTAVGVFGRLSRVEDRPPADLVPVRRTGFALGAGVSILALGESRARAVRALDAAFTEIRTVEALMSLHHPESQLRRLNREGALSRPHPYLVRVLREACELSEATAGGFDVTVQPLWNLYATAKVDGRLPAPDEIERVRGLVDWRRIEVSEDRIRLTGRGTEVTLNGIAQGFAADRARAGLEANGIEHALLDTGEIGALGRRRDGERWTVDIEHPRDAGAFLSRVRLDGRSVATSGDYATCFSPDRVHHHIFDPRTGRSPTAFQSVTVLARSGLQADALSTAIFVTGLHRGIDLVESTSGADALFVTKDGATATTSGFPVEA